MHELAVTESILKIALDNAQKAQAKRVTQINLVLGKLSSIVDDSVQFYWDFISEGTICQGASLHFERVPARFTCLDCSATYALDGDLTPCPACGSQRVKLVSGDEFRLDSIEIEKE
jgi:hydrogenase nickel incorporation protein HypA/HybF